MTAGDTLRTIVDALDDAHIPHMLVGSFASSVHGAPRTTQDIDLVIDPTPGGLERFVISLESAGYYVSPSALDALDRRDQFNAVDPVSGWKIDLIICKERPFSRCEFDRRIEAQVLGARVWLATSEDTVLAKLEWAAMGASDRQVADAATVLAVRGEAIDQDYLDRWAEELGVQDLLARARRPT